MPSPSCFCCARMLVYEYVDNGNLEQWLHGEVGPYSPLTWEIRMNIILGTAKGYTVGHLFDQIRSWGCLIQIVLLLMQIDVPT